MYRVEVGSIPAPLPFLVQINPRRVNSYMNTCNYCNKPVKNKYCGVSCQNRDQNTKRADRKYGKYCDYTVSCYKCHCKFIVQEREKQHPKKEKYFCSRVCANSKIHTEETKQKISNALTGLAYNRKHKPKPKELFRRICEDCGTPFETTNKKRILCSLSCAGRRSANKQSETRRSKNEKYFAQLCIDRFDRVKTNEPMFNGWDADVVIEDIKVAVLWNGKWHYEKLAEGHSVKQVHNRDKIKQKEIRKLGYTPYIIKDMGKFDKAFVLKQFKEFLTNI